MPVAGLLAGAAERHALQDRDVVLDHRRLADHETGRVIEKMPLPIRAAGLMSTPNAAETRLCRLSAKSRLPAFKSQWDRR